jgi:soluble lytic murein transglycosylase-like protein
MTCVVAAVVVACACSNPAMPDAPQLVLPPPTDATLLEPGVAMPSSSPPASALALRQADVKQLLVAAAQRQGVNPYVVMAVAWWESGWDQSQVSPTGAVGIMQIEPATAASAGPRLLNRTADIHDPADNIELGVAVLKEDLDNFHNDLTKALIAYYEGPAAVTDWNAQDAGAKRYVWGVYRLAVAFSNGTGPA